MKAKITEEMKWRESLIKNAKRYGVSNAARRYKVNRQYIYRWMKRYDGTVRSLANKSTKPHHHPNEHTKEEIKLIRDMYKKNKDTGLVVFWVKLRQRGYTRTVSGLYNAMVRLGIYEKKKRKRKPKVKKYIQPTYPGERIQIDIKYVPSKCLLNGEKMYQYTAIDEYTRLRHLQIYEEANTYTSVQFMEEVIKSFPFPIKEVRTDNGIQFTNRLVSKHEKPTLFEIYLKQKGIKQDYIKPFTPKHNGKVERSHRKDSERFYRNRVFYNLKDARRQIKKYEKEYNEFPMGPLGFLSPKEYFHNYKVVNGNV